MANRLRSIWQRHGAGQSCVSILILKVDSEASRRTDVHAGEVQLDVQKITSTGGHVQNALSFVIVVQSADGLTLSICDRLPHHSAVLQFTCRAETETHTQSQNLLMEQML